jgi:hypothetical protein
MTALSGAPLDWETARFLRRAGEALQTLRTWPFRVVGNFGTKQPMVKAADQFAIIYW